MPPSDFKRAVQNFPLNRWLSEKVGRVTGGDTHARINCPHCGGKKTLSVNLSKKNCQCFKCFEGGHAGNTWTGKGSLVDLVALVEGISAQDAVLRIRELAGLPETPRNARSFAKTAPISLPEDLYPLTAAAENHAARVILRDRGLGNLENRIFLCLSGMYAERWVLPTYYLGTFTGFEAKAYRKNMLPKSLFPDWLKTKNTVYTTYSWDYLQDFAIITESIFDAETLGSNAVGIFGSVLREGQFGKLLEFLEKGISRLIWFLDEDAFTKQANSILSKTRTLFTNYVVDVPKGQDPNSLGRERCWELVASARPVFSSLDIFANRVLH